MTQGWTGRQCPKCGGTGEERGDGSRHTCQACWGTGDEYGEMPEADAPSSIREPDQPN